MTFWNKVQRGVGRAAAEAEKQAKIARINLQVGDVESTIRRKKLELGETAFELVKDGKLTEPSLDTIMESIREQETRLATLRREMSEIQEVQEASDTPEAPPPA